MVIIFIIAMILVPYIIWYVVVLNKTKRVLSTQLQYLPVVPSSGIVLTGGEIGHYQGRASSAVIKNVVTGYERRGSSHRTSGRMWWGSRVWYSHNHYSGNTKVVRGDVETKYSGRLYVTNRRIIMAAPKAGFEKKLQSITAVSIGLNVLNIQFGDKAYKIYTKDAALAYKLVDGVLRGLPPQNQWAEAPSYMPPFTAPPQ